MNIALTPELERFVQREVAKGLYSTAEEAVLDAVSRRQEEQMSRALGTPQTLEELEARLLESIDRLDRGEGVDGEEVFHRLKKRMAAAPSGA